MQRLTILLKGYFGFSNAMTSKAPEVRISIMFGAAAPISGPAEFVVREAPFKIPIESVLQEKPSLFLAKYRRSPTNQYWFSGGLIYTLKNAPEKRKEALVLLELLQSSWDNLHQGAGFAAHLYVDGKRRPVAGKIHAECMPIPSFFKPIEVESRPSITSVPPEQLKVRSAA